MSSQLDVYSFGRRLLETNDLDPVYVVVWNAIQSGDLADATLRRWLLAYWCFYHVGTACWVVDNKTEYWEAMKTAAGSKDYPRSSERRHFRGANAMNSVKYLEGRGSAGLFDDLAQCGTSSRQVIEIVRQWVGFGPWIAFKVADMIERIGLRHVEFDHGTAMYEGSPTEAAQELWRRENPGQGRRSPTKDEGEWAVSRILSELGTYPAPPSGDRTINAQEAETILCKWKSYLGGHYEIGEDILAVRKGLCRFARVSLSQRLFAGGRRGGLW